MKKYIILILVFFLSLNFTFWQWVSDVLETAKSKISERLYLTSSQNWTNWIQFFIRNVWLKILFPLLIAVSIIVALIWFYKLFFSDKEDEQTKWRQFIIWGPVWIMIMVAATFITYRFVWTSWWWDNSLISMLKTQWWWIYLAEYIYSDIVYPFIKVWIYISIMVLFMILLFHCFKYITNPEDSFKEWSKRIIIWNTIWILIALWAKNIVEIIYWRRDQIWYWVSNLWDIWWWVLENQYIYILYSSLNRIIWLISFIVVVIIIYQTYLILAVPENQDNLKKLKRNFIYIFIWIILIWWWYIISNFLIYR